MDKLAEQRRSVGSCTWQKIRQADFFVLTHGAGGNCNGPLLVALAEALSAKGLDHTALLICLSVSGVPTGRLRPPDT